MSALEELKAVIEKHNLSISFECSDCSNLHGIYGEKIIIEDEHGKELLSVNGFSLDKGDIKTIKDVEQDDCCNHPDIRMNINYFDDESYIEESFCENCEAEFTDFWTYSKRVNGSNRYNHGAKK